MAHRNLYFSIFSGERLQKLLKVLTLATHSKSKTLQMLSSPGLSAVTSLLYIWQGEDFFA